MKLRSTTHARTHARAARTHRLSLCLIFLALTSLAAAQTCPGGLTASNNWCGSYTAVDANCRSGPGGSSQGTCTGLHGGYNVGFFAKTGGSGNPSISAPELNSDYGADSLCRQVRQQSLTRTRNLGARLPASALTPLTT